MVLLNVILAAALGASNEDRVKVEWGKTPKNELIYDVHLEPSLAREIEDGRLIEGGVPISVQDLSYFRISMHPKGSADPASDLKRTGRTRQDPGVLHGWRPQQDGQMEYLIQIGRSRFRELERGIPIEGALSPEAGIVRHITIFVDDEPQLERINANAEGGMVGNWTPNIGTAFNTRANHNSTTANSNFRTTDSRGNSPLGYRSPIAPSIRRNSVTDMQDQAPAFFDFGNTNWTRNEMAAQRPATQNYGSQYNAGVDYPRLAQNPNSGQFDNEFASGRQSTNINPTGYPNRNESLLHLQNASLNSGAIQPPAKASLLLTGLGLAVSLGFNAYLGWLSWTFFWRYREVASELARARTDALNTRQFA